jgi:hypothetical protein
VATLVDDGHPRSQRAGGHAPVDQHTDANEPALLRELMTHQRELLDELREELAARRREVQQLHTLLAQAQQRALPPPDEWEPDTTVGPISEAPSREVVAAGVLAPVRPWWRFWK